jgi:hypothetical protein
VTVSIEIRDAVIAALNADLPSDIPTATKRRVMPGEPVRAAFIAVFLGQEAVNYPGNKRGPLTARSLEVLIELGLATDDLAAVDDLIEPMRAHVVERLGDTNLGGLATAVLERGIPENGRPVWKLDLYNAVTFVRYDVEYQTARNDLGARQ